MIFLKIVGYINALPLTILGLIYTTIFCYFGWYSYIGIRENSLIFFVNNDKLPSFIKKIWNNYAGHAIGNVIVMRYNPDVGYGITILLHELEHTRQCMILGLLQPILYILNCLLIIIICRKSNYYFSNIFEIEARRAAGQTIDVEGSYKALLKFAALKRQPHQK